MSPALILFDLAGTFVFALSGAMSGIKHRLDLFGVLVLSFAAGNVGGITRDVLLGATPPPAISDWRYLGASLLAGLITFAWFPLIDRLRSSVLVLDAAGLALFAVSGALKALAVGLNPAAAILLGVVTGVGGGILRDVLVSEVPAVLRGELYASAALAGAATVVLGRLLYLPSPIGAATGAIVCFVLRYLAIRQGWRLPVPPPLEPPPAHDVRSESPADPDHL